MPFQVSTTPIDQQNPDTPLFADQDARNGNDEASGEAQNNSETLLEEDDGILFSCRCESVNPVVTLLSCLRKVSARAKTGGATASLNGIDGGRHSRAQYATVFVNEKNLTFQVQGMGRQSRAKVQLDAGLFSDYYVADRNLSSNSQNKDSLSQDDTDSTIGGKFGINLTTVIECLCVLGQSSVDRAKLTLSYDSYDAIFKIELLEDDGTGGGMIISNGAISGMSVADDQNDENDPNALDQVFQSIPVAAQTRISSTFLKEAMSELSDVHGAVSATIGISKLGLELIATGHSTECHVIVPYAGNHPISFISLEGLGDEKTLHARDYPLHLILSACRSTTLDIATESSITMNIDGMLEVHHQVFFNEIGNGSPNYVSFIMTCLDDDIDGEGNIDENMEQDNTYQMKQDDVINPIMVHDENSELNLHLQGSSQLMTENEYDNKSQQTKTIGSSDSEEEDEGSSSQILTKPAIPLFGTIAEIGESANQQAKKLSKEKSKNRSLENSHRRHHSNLSGSSSSHDESDENEWVDDNDKLPDEPSTPPTSTLFSRRSLPRKKDEDHSSPELMYGDMPLENDSSYED